MKLSKIASLENHEDVSKRWREICVSEWEQWSETALSQFHTAHYYIPYILYTNGINKLWLHVVCEICSICIFDCGRSLGIRHHKVIVYTNHISLHFLFSAVNNP